ncbi:IS3 family transposase [Streptomyces sp. NPDC014744]|uniref:IS3 family transposase n=1 Tax=Streptomyces sp. NPDC014744 TaxID=3364903 RepID=UPI00370046B3
MPLIEEIHAESGGTYGARRITRALRRKGVDVARCAVERLMAELGLEGVIRGQRRRTTLPEPSAPARRTWSTAASFPRPLLARLPQSTISPHHPAEASAAARPCPPLRRPSLRASPLRR